MNKYSKTAKLGDILIQKKEITKEQLNDALKSQSENGKKLGEMLV